MCFFISDFCNLECIYKLHITKKNFVNNFCKKFFAQFRSDSSPALTQFFILFQIVGQFKLSAQFLITVANCRKRNFLVEVLRCFSFMEVFLNPNYYGKHCKFDLAFNSKKDKTSSLHFFFFNFFQISIFLSLKNVTLDQFSNDNICTLKNEAIVNRKGSE